MLTLDTINGDGSSATVDPFARLHLAPLWDAYCAKSEPRVSAEGFVNWLLHALEGMDIAAKPRLYAISYTGERCFHADECMHYEEV